MWYGSRYTFRSFIYSMNLSASKFNTNILPFMYVSFRNHLIFTISWYFRVRSIQYIDQFYWLTYSKGYIINRNYIYEFAKRFNLSNFLCRRNLMWFTLHSNFIEKKNKTMLKEILWKLCVFWQKCCQSSDCQEKTSLKYANKKNNQLQWRISKGGWISYRCKWK